jgi:hypothetical protein
VGIPGLQSGEEVNEVRLVGLRDDYTTGEHGLFDVGKNAWKRWYSRMQQCMISTGCR